MTGKVNNWKSILLIVFFLGISILVFQPVHAVEKTRAYGTEDVRETFYQGDTVQVINGGTIKVFEQNLKFNIVSNGTKLYIRDLNSDEFISLLKKKCDLLNYTRICFDEGGSSSANIRIYTLVPDLEVTQYLEKEDMLVGEDNHMRVVIENLGMLDCEECFYQEKLHPQMEITEIDGAELYNDTIKWNGTLEGESTKIIEYGFRSLGKFSYNSTANVTYSNYINWLELTAKADFEVNSWIDFKSTIPEETHLGEKTVILWNLTNVNKNNISIDRFKVTIPKDIKVTRLPVNIFGYNFENDEYMWAGKLPYNESKEFWIEFIPKRTGQIRIPLELNYRVSDEDNISYPYIKPLIFDVVHKDISIEPEFNISEALEASSEKTLEFALRNTDANVDYTGVNIRAFNDFFEKNINVEKLPHSTAKKIDLDFPTPTVNRERDFPLNFELEYTTSYGNKVNSSAKKALTVAPKEEIKVSHNFSKTNISGGDVVGIDVYLESQTPFRIKNITVKDIIPDELFTKGIVVKNINFLEPGERFKALSYEVQMPVVEENKTINITLGNVIDYEVQETKRSLSRQLKLPVESGDMTIIQSLMEQASVTSSTVRNFSTLPMIVLLIVSAILLAASVATVYNYTQDFGIPGIKTIQAKERTIQRRKKNILKEEKQLRQEQAKLDSKMVILKNFLNKTKEDMKKKLPASDEKKTQLDSRKEELMRQKKEIDAKVKELQEEEEKLMAKYNSLESEKKSVVEEENALNEKYEKMKNRLVTLKNDFENMINKEGNLEKKKEQLNDEEIKLMKNKEKLLDSGSVKIVSEKEGIVDEKVKLEHEKNKIEEELSSLKSKKKDISEEQENIKQQKVELKNEMNVFDTDKSTVEKSIKFLNAENDRLKKLLEETKNDDDNKKKENA